MINSINTNTISNVNTDCKPSFKGIYNNKLLLNGLKFASENSALFCATTTLGLSLAARPLAILSTPKTDKKNKQYACAKALASSAVGYLIMLGASLPVASSIKKIDKAPQNYLTKETISFLKKRGKSVSNSPKYMFATQIFKLGTGLILAIPKSVLTCSLIPPIMKKLFPQNNTNTPRQNTITIKTSKAKPLSFKGLYNIATEKLAVGIGKIIDTNAIKQSAEKYYKTNFAQHIMNFTDVLLTATFIKQTQKNKNIKENRKKALIHNSVISTGLSITGGYAVNKALNKPTERFIQNFKKANKSLPNLEKYVDGIRIAKPALILGVIYYILIPTISTFFADRTSKYIEPSSTNYKPLK